MGVLQRIRVIVRHGGPAGIIRKAAALAFDAAFEVRYGVDTLRSVPLSQLTIDSPNRAGAASHYEASRVLPSRVVLQALRRRDPDGALVDVGSGKGKVLLLAAQCGVKRVRGLEFAPELCRIARGNWDRFRARTQLPCDLEVLQVDAAEYVFQPEETLFFMFRPFDVAVFDKMLANLAASIQRHPRQVFMAIAFFAESFSAASLAEHGFHVETELRTWACSYSIVTNRGGSLAPT